MNLFRGEVEVELGGEKRLIKFGLNQLALFTEKTGKSLDEVSFGVADLRLLIWSALYAGAKKQGKPFDIDEWTVGDWLDEIQQEDFDLIMKTITESMPESDTKKKPARSRGRK